MTIDARRILTAQGVRAFVYGFGSVLLGVTLDARGWSGARVGLLLTAVVAGTALTSVLVGRYGDRIGRRRMYGLLFLGLAGAGFVFAFVDQFWVLVAV
ncbi:MAG TPA: MFS transporter, partial [Actinomycetota bacterium]|nr:MFS transporter [Actinomycetota bacterium]